MKLGLLLTCLLALVAPQPRPTPDPAPDTTRTRSGDGVDKVLLVSVDGLNPRAISAYPPERTPAFHRLIDEGVSTLDARTLREETRTLPNHATMLTGRRAALPRGHGLRVNRDPGGTLRRTAGGYVAGVFDVVHDHGGSTAMYVAKEKFRFLARSWNRRHGAPDAVGVDDGRDKVDRFVHREARDDLLVANLQAELSSSPRQLTFLHLSAPDRAGHEYGGMSRRYLRAVRSTDALLGTLLETIDSSPGLRERLLVIVTADHGTGARRHSDPRRPANYRIPFLAWGPGVARGADLYALNPDFERPGRTRPGYRGLQPVRNGNAANLVTDVLGLPAVPGSEFDRARTLDLR